MILLLSLLSSALAGPTKGLRTTLCAGLSSHCPFVQLGLSYVNNRVGIDVGGFALPFGANIGLRYFLADAEKNNRLFIGASAGGAISGIYDFSAAGLNVGADFHLFSDRKTILTPRIGVDYTNSGGLLPADGFIPKLTDAYALSFSLGAARAF